MPRENIEGVEIPLDPEAVGSENPMAPGEPDPARQEASSPVSGTGYERKREHRAEHNAEGNVEDRPAPPQRVHRPGEQSDAVASGQWAVGSRQLGPGYC